MGFVWSITSVAVAFWLGAWFGSVHPRSDAMTEASWNMAGHIAIGLVATVALLIAGAL